MNANGQLLKRRKDVDEDGFDDSGGQGAKHWTDEEKTKLFRWLMGPNSDDHWNALRATKNSCLRDVLPIIHLLFSILSDTRLVRRKGLRQEKILPSAQRLL